jgi:predicted amidohydrolase
VSQKHKLGIIQFDVKFGQIDANLATVLEEIDFLAKQKAELALLPEIWSSGFDNPHMAAHAERTPAILKALCDAAASHQMILAGSLPQAKGGKIYNTHYLVDADGSVAGAYQKVHLFSLTDEHKYFAAGNRAVVCQTAIGPVGLMVCYDLRFPELCRRLALDGAGLVLVPAQWPLVRIAAWNALIKARAIENQLFMAAVNRCGNDRNQEYGGHSQVVSPTGEIYAMVEKGACSLCAEIDFAEMERVRARMPCLKERVPEAYGPEAYGPETYG